MPQMSPMNWLMLMIMFTLILVMCISLIYFIYLPQNSNNKKNINKIYYIKNKKNLIWKW